MAKEKKVRGVLEMGGEIWIETRAGSKEWKKITKPVAVFNWKPGGTYKLSEAIRFFKDEKAANRFIVDNWNDDFPPLCKNIFDRFVEKA